MSSGDAGDMCHVGEVTYRKNQGQNKHKSWEQAWAVVDLIV